MTKTTRKNRPQTPPRRTLQKTYKRKSITRSPNVFSKVFDYISKPFYIKETPKKESRPYSGMNVGERKTYLGRKKASSTAYSGMSRKYAKTSTKNKTRKKTPSPRKPRPYSYKKKTPTPSPKKPRPYSYKKKTPTPSPKKPKTPTPPPKAPSAPKAPQAPPAPKAKSTKKSLSPLHKKGNVVLTRNNMTLSDALNILKLSPTKQHLKKDIVKAYRLRAKRLHPDKHGGSEAATEKFKQLGDAYEIACKRSGFQC